MNPFRHMGQYYWRDEQHRMYGPYRLYSDALYDLLDHTTPPVSWLERVCRKFCRRFIKQREPAK